MNARTSHHSSPETSKPCIASTWRREWPIGSRAGMQEDPVVRIALVPASSNQMGSHIISDRCVQRSCSAKLYALRIARHGGQREQHLTPHLSIKRGQKPENPKLRRGLCNSLYRLFILTLGILRSSNHSSDPPSFNSLLSLPPTLDPFCSNMAFRVCVLCVCSDARLRENYN